MKPFFIYRIIGRFHNIGAIWDNIAPSEENAIIFAHENINPEPERHLDATHYSYEYCLAHSGETINERFRQDRPDDIDMKIADMVATHTTKIPIVVYRGVCEMVLKQMIENARGMDGVDLFEKSFLQTSLVKGHESRSQYHLRIYVPEGTQAVYLGAVNDEQFYYEVDIQHKVKLKILSIDDTYINCIIV